MPAPLKPSADAPRALGYIRVSTAQQAELGLSLDVQRELLRKHAELRDLELVGVEADEGLSAGSLKRPGLKAAMKALLEGRANALLVMRLDRLTRSVVDLDWLLSQYFSDGEYALISVSESIDTRSANGRMMLYLIGLFAQWEREKVRERVQEVVTYKRERKEYLGGHLPYGYTQEEGKLVAMDVEQQVARLARQMRLDGATYRQVAQELSARGFLNRSGKVFGPSTIVRICGEAKQRPKKKRERSLDPFS